MKSSLLHKTDTPAERAKTKRARALAGWITLVNGLGMLMLALTSQAAHAQTATFPRANTQPALQAADATATVPLASYSSNLAKLPRGVESQSTDWRNANDTVGQFKRGHIDLLKLENASPAQPEAQPSQPGSQR